MELELFQRMYIILFLLLLLYDGILVEVDKKKAYAYVKVGEARFDMK